MSGQHFRGSLEQFAYPAARVPRGRRVLLPPNRHEAPIARNREYSAIWQRCDRECRKPEYQTASFSQRSQMLAVAVEDLLDKRNAKGHPFCGTDVQSIFNRHLQRGIRRHGPRSDLVTVPVPVYNSPYVQGVAIDYPEVGQAGYEDEEDDKQQPGDDGKQAADDEEKASKICPSPASGNDNVHQGALDKDDVVDDTPETKDSCLTTPPQGNILRSRQDRKPDLNSTMRTIQSDLRMLISNQAPSRSAKPRPSGLSVTTELDSLRTAVADTNRRLEALAYHAEADRHEIFYLRRALGHTTEARDPGFPPPPPSAQQQQQMASLNGMAPPTPDSIAAAVAAAPMPHMSAYDPTMLRGPQRTEYAERSTGMSSMMKFGTVDGAMQ